MDLNGYVALYIPTKDAKGARVDNWRRTRVLNEVKETFSKAFGGYTAYEAEGGWVGDSGLVKEEITVVKAFYETDGYVVLNMVTGLAKMVKARLNQEAVTIEQNGGVSFK